MSKHPKTKLYDWQEKDIVIMPSTKKFSVFINNTNFLIMLGLWIWIVFFWGLFTAIFVSVVQGIIMALLAFLPARIIDFLTKTRKNRKGYIKVDRQTAFKLVDLEKLYGQLNATDKTIYQGYLEGAYYGEATVDKVTKLFQNKINSYIDNKPLDTLIDMDLNDA